MGKIKDVKITKLYKDGRVVTVNVKGYEDRELSVGESTNNSTASYEIYKEKKHQDEKYYDAIHVGTDLKSIFDSFNEMCETMNWD